MRCVLAGCGGPAGQVLGEWARADLARGRAVRRAVQYERIKAIDAGKKRA